MSWPPRSRDDELPKSSRTFEAALSRIERCSRLPFSCPTGAARFCARSALHDLIDADARDCRSVGRSSTFSCALSPPTTFTCATPAIERSSPRDRLDRRARELRRRQRGRRERERHDRRVDSDRSAE